MWYIGLSIFGFILICIEFWRTRKDNFNFGLLLFIISYVFVLYTSLMSVRLMMVYGVFINIPIAYLAWKSWEKAEENKGKKEAWFWDILFAVFITLIVISWYAYYAQITYEAFCNFNSISKCGESFKGVGIF